MSLTDKLYISTIADDAVEMACKYHTGIEISEFCTAANMDRESFAYWDGVVKEKLACSERIIFHAPFNELNPSAVDPLAVKLALERLNQAYCLAASYGIRRMVVHSGYIPLIYFKDWFHDRSVEFWKAFMDDKPEDFSIMIENVLDDEPDTLKSIVSEIADPRVGICLDIGHAHVMSAVDLKKWIYVLAPIIMHVHLHNNDQSSDKHWELGKGAIAMKEVIHHIISKAPNATMTIENMHCGPSIQWLHKNDFLQD